MAFNFDSLDFGKLSSEQQVVLLDKLLQSTALLSSSTLQNYIAHGDELRKELGVAEKDFRPQMQEILVQLRKHFEFLQRVGVGEDVKLLSLSLSPRDLVYEMGSRLVEAGASKELVKARLENLNAVLDLKLEELIPVGEEAEVEMERVVHEGEKREELLLPERQETLDYTLQILREKLAKLKEAHASLNVVETFQMDQLVKKHKDLKIRDAEVTAKLSTLSSNGNLPSNLAEAQTKFNERYQYCSALKHQITRLQDISEDGDSSVFGGSNY